MHIIFLQNHHDASDVVLNTMMKVWSKIDQYDTKWHISTWIYAIAYKNGICPILSNRKVELNKNISISSNEK